MSTAPVPQPDQDFQYIKLPDGSYGKFAANASDAEIRGHIEKDFPDAYKSATSEPSAPTPGPIGKINAGLADSPDDGILKSVGKKAGRAIMGPVGEIADTVKGVIDLPKQTQIDENAPNDEYAVGKMTSLPGTNTSLGLPLYKMGKSIIGQGVDTVKAGYNAAKQGEGMPGIALSEFEKLPLAGDIVQDMEHGNAIGGVTKGITRAGILGATAKAPKIPEAIRSIPNVERAVGNFKTVAKSAGVIPVDVSLPGAQALEIQRLAESGGSMPKVIRDFVKRATNPKKGPITYNEARDFYSNASRLSADETMRLTPRMKMEVGNFRETLNKSILDAAKRGGKGQEYQAAMKEYGAAMRNRKFADKAIDLGKQAAVKGAIGAVGGGAAGAGAYGIYKLFGDR